ncbi:ABC transporter ATP-binding protein [Thermogladius sp.]|uniref:ABC transporter ATP-binding protein n=1 Tax=Thermogladius sp. TaxID=2023064 RepID=UPI003D0D0795
MVLAVEARNLSIGYLDEDDNVVLVVRNASFSVEEGEVCCLVGESGSGKTTLGNSIAGVLPPYTVTRGLLYLFGKLVVKDELRFYEGVRGRLVSYIPQNPGSSLSPYMRVWDQFWRVMKAHGFTEETARKKVVEILRLLNLKTEVLELYPHELSGGMQQRVAVGLSLVTGAKLLVADEPTSSVDAHLKLQLMRLFREIKGLYGITIVLITHDILLAGKVCDRILVMYGGEIVEVSGANELLENPLHPYTRLLTRVVPVLGYKKKLESIPGEPPRPGQVLEGCVFYERCPVRGDECVKTPPAREVEGRVVKCWRPLIRESALLS